MARRRFFVPAVRRGEAELTGTEAEHLVRVLRAEAGQVHEISDNSRVYLARIETARKSAVTFRVLEEITVPELPVRTTLYAALFKFDRFELMLEKATELGVDLVQPFQAVRSERGLSEAAHKRQPRWERLLFEASQQARRATLPAVRPPVVFAALTEVRHTTRLLLDEDAGAKPLAEEIDRPRDVGLVIGPEGGWTDAERAALQQAGWRSCSLGPLVLRSETAAIAGLAVIMAAACRRE